MITRSIIWSKVLGKLLRINRHNHQSFVMPQYWNRKLVARKRNSLITSIILTFWWRFSSFGVFQVTLLFYHIWWILRDLKIWAQKFRISNFHTFMTFSVYAVNVDKKRVNMKFQEKIEAQLFWSKETSYSTKIEEKLQSLFRFRAKTQNQM